jgi:hypothetical protein
MPDLPTYDLGEIGGVSRALAELDKGGSEDVAAVLAELGIVGQRDNDCACPIANYLVRVLPDAEYVQVGGGAAYITGTVRDDLGYSWPVVVHTETPDSITAFVEDFDQGIYPELIEKTEEVSTDVG